MAKKIQKKQIEDGVFVETKATYSAPTQDNEFVQKKYVDEEVAKKADISHTHSWTDITNKPRISVTLADTAISRTYTIGLTGANNSSGKLIIPKAVSWNDVTDKPTFPTLPNWVTQTKPTYDWSEIQNKPALNYLPLTGGVLTPGDVVWYDGLKIAKSTAGWSTFLLGSDSNLDDKSWMIARNPQGQLMIQSTDNGFDTGLLLSNDFLRWKGFTFNVTKEGKISGKTIVEAPILRVHTPETDWVSLNSKGNKLNVKDGAAGRDGESFKPVLASGYEVPNGTNNRLLTANGENYGLGVGQKQTIDLKGLNENKYYLVYCAVSTMDRVRVRVQNALNYTSKPSWSTHDGGFSLNLEFEQTGNGWGSTHSDINITQYNHLWSNVEPIMYINQIGQSNKMFMYLRGGGEYYVYQWSQVGESQVWINPRKNEGNFEENGVSLPYCRDWDNNLKVVATNIRSYKDESYGEVTKIDKPIVIREVVIDNGTSKNNLWTANNELNVGSRNVGGYAKISCNGYKIQGKDDNYLLTAGGNSISKSELLSLPRGYDTSTSVVLPATTVNDTVFVKASITLGLENIPNKGSVSFLKTFDGGSVTFVCAGKNIIYTGDNSFNGKDGSTATVTIFENKCYIRIANV
jgi:hypothetical protein|nr:MAG TPA: tail protein [Caudoviricetes sp.]